VLGKSITSRVFVSHEFIEVHTQNIALKKHVGGPTGLIHFFLPNELEQTGLKWIAPVLNRTLAVSDDSMLHSFMSSTSSVVLSIDELFVRKFP